MYLGQLKKRYSLYVDITLDKSEKGHIVVIYATGISYNFNLGEGTFYDLKLEVNKSKKIKVY